MPDGWGRMKAAVQRGAERELELSIKPGFGPLMDVKVEGRYLGWCSPKQGEELQKLYDETPSRLSRGSGTRLADLDGFVVEVALALKRCRQIEADMMLFDKRIDGAALHDLRNRLETLHTQALMLRHNQDFGTE